MLCEDEKGRPKGGLISCGEGTNYGDFGGVAGVVEVVAGFWTVGGFGVVVPLFGLRLEVGAEAGAGTPDCRL